MTTPAQPANAADVDQALAQRATDSGQQIAGLITAAMLDTAGSPSKLPQYLFPDADPALVQKVWEAAIVVGYRAGKLATAPRFNRDTLARLHAALTDAGHHAMGRLIAQTRTALPPPPVHPADETAGHTRGGHE